MKHLKSYGVILGVIQEFLLGNKFGFFLLGQIKQYARQVVQEALE